MGYPARTTPSSNSGSHTTSGPARNASGAQHLTWQEEEDADIEREVAKVYNTMTTTTTTAANSATGEEETVEGIPNCRRHDDNDNDNPDYDYDHHGRVKEPFHIVEEMGRLFHIAIPSVGIQCALYFVFPQAASVVGRTLGTQALAGFSLGSLTGNLTCLSVLVGALSAADTLMPRAYGSQRYDELGRLALRSVIVSFLLLIPPVIPLLFCMEWILDKLGQDAVASALAAQWIRVYLLGAPANLLFRVVQRFLIAQHIPWPPCYAGLIPCFTVCPFLLHVLVPTMGLVGSAWAIVLTQWSMLFLLLAYLYCCPVYHPESWPGWSWRFVREAASPEPLFRFFHLALAGVLSLSEWWFWETMCFVAGSLGVIPLCAHTIAYNFIPMLFMIPLGVSIGLTVRMGTVLANNAFKAQQMAAWTLMLMVAVASVVALALYMLEGPVIRLFTADSAVIQLSQAIWPKVCIYVFMLYVFGINSAILRALGLQWRLAFIIFWCLWFLLLPAVMWFALYNHGGLTVQWTLLPVGYTTMNIFLTLSYTTFDWEERSASIRETIRRSMDQQLATALIKADLTTLQQEATEQTGLLA